MNVSIPVDVRRLVTQAAISTAALERESVDDSSWIVRAVAEKLEREWDLLAMGDAVPDAVHLLARRALGRPEMAGRSTCPNTAPVVDTSRRLLCPA